METTDRVVIVAGAAGGIGTQIRAQLGALGYSIIALDIVEAPPSIGREENTRSFAVDCSDPHEVEAVVTDALRELGQLHGLVNASGVFAIKDFVETGRDDWISAIQSNLLTAMATSRVAAPRLLATQAGSIVNIASTAGEVGSFRPAAAYSAAKGGVIAFTKALARELSPQGVRANVVSPGPVMTKMVQITTEEQEREASKKMLLGRMGQPSDIANAVQFLLGDDSTWITGTVMQVNGGCVL